MVADCLSRPPEALSLHGSTHVASIKEPSGSLASPVQWDSSAGASTTAAVAQATEQQLLDWEELARDQVTCTETQAVLEKQTSLTLEKVVYRGVDLWCLQGC